MIKKFGFSFFEMRNIISLFDDIRYVEFIRLIIFNDSILLIHIKNEKLLNTLSITLENKSDVFSYLRENETTPIEVVVSSNTISCKSIPVSKLKERDIISLANNMLAEKNESANVLFYEKKLFYRNNTISMCSMKLSSLISTIIQEILIVKNSVVSVTSWPIWIVASYFDLYPLDVDKFLASLFIVEYKESWEMIALHNKSYVCYRRGNIDNFNRKLEIENTIKYINQTLKIDPNDIAVYSIGKDTVLSFTKNSPIDMKIISKTGKFEVSRCSKSADRITKFGIGVLFLMIFTNTILDAVKMLDYQQKIDEANVIINSVDKNVIEEIAMWKDVDVCDYTLPMDFKAILFKNSSNKRLRNASINIDAKTNEALVNVIADE